MRNESRLHAVDEHEPGVTEPPVGVGGTADRGRWVSYCAGNRVASDTPDAPARRAYSLVVFDHVDVAEVVQPFRDGLVGLVLSGDGQ